MFLHILAIIGIVLLCIVAFIVLVLLLVLFMPFRYKIRADGNTKDISADAAVKWLFGFVRVCVSYGESKISYKVKVLFINILKGEINLKKDEEEKEDEPARPTKKELNQAKKKEEKAKKKKEAKDQKAQEKKEEKEKKEEEKRIQKEAEKKENKEKSAVEKISLLSEKLKKIQSKVKTVKYIWDAPVTKRALSFLKETVFKLLNHLKPRVLTGRIVFNLSDPNTMAQIYAIASIILGSMGAQLILEPDFDNEGISIENVVVKGRIFAGYMLLLALKVLMDKDVKRVIKYIRRNL